MTPADVPNAATADLQSELARLGQGALAYCAVGLKTAPNVVLVQAIQAELKKRAQG